MASHFHAFHGLDANNLQHDTESKLRLGQWHAVAGGVGATHFWWRHIHLMGVSENRVPPNPNSLQYLLYFELAFWGIIPKFWIKTIIISYIIHYYPLGCMDWPFQLGLHTSPTCPRLWWQPQARHHLTLTQTHGPALRSSWQKFLQSKFIANFGSSFVKFYDVYEILWGFNPFFLLIKLPQLKKNRIGVALPFFLVGHNWILNCGNWKSIGEQDGETMGSTPY